MILSRSSLLRASGSATVAAMLPVGVRAEATPLRTAGVYADLFGEPFFAAGAGAFVREGFNVETISEVNAGAVAAALGGGALDLGTGDLVSGVNAIGAGVPIVLFAGGGLYRTGPDSPSVIIAVANGSPVRMPSDLRGKSISVPTLVGMTTACVKSWLTEHGAPAESMKFLEMPPSAALPALQRGTLDAAVLSEPFVTFGKGQMRAIGSPYDVAAGRAHGKAICVSVWYASKAWVAADPDRARRALRAIYDTARWANAHHDETFEILVRDGKLDADKARGMYRTTFATSLDADQIQPVLDVAIQNNLIKPITARSLIGTGA